MSCNWVGDGSAQLREDTDILGDTMTVKFIKQNLPWMAPSVAIVLAASGYFEGARDGAEELMAETAAVVTAPAPENLIAAPRVSALSATTIETPDVGNDLQSGQPSGQDVSQNTNIATSLSSLTAAGALTAQEPEQVQPVSATPVVPEPQAPARVEVSAAENPTAFFAAAQASLAAKASCVDDLRSLTSQARVYFPSAGLAGEDRGMAQARLIGLVAQECPGVRIRVEGHSDPSGNPQVNLRLSKERAEAIIARVAAAGIDTTRFEAVGYGDREPSTIRGELQSNYYDRRVEFSVVERNAPVAVSSLTAALTQVRLAPCVSELQAAVEDTKVFYSLRSITSSPADTNVVLDLAFKAQACPQARLRVVGQHSDEIGSGESPATGRLRAVAMMNALVGAGVDAGEIIMAAPSYSAEIPGQPGLSTSRLDFQVILEDG